MENSTTATMSGTIKGNTEKQFDKMVANEPHIERIILKDCPGSKNDEVNLIVAKKIHDAGIKTELRADSEIASGAVDLFLAGVERKIASGAKIGVHSWSGDGKEGANLPEDDPNHLPYINYYISVGMSEQEAKDFYFFTIHAAPADAIHWMTTDEIEQYGLVTP